MQKIRLLCVGKLKEDYLRGAQAEYLKRLGGFCKVEVIEIPPYRFSERPSPAELEAGMKEEGKLLLQKASGFLIPMCIEGKKFSSEELAAQVAKLSVEGAGDLTFIIGGSYGLSEEVKRAGQLRLSMSEMTFPHQLARIMLLEQIYRVLQINNGGKYHK